MDTKVMIEKLVDAFAMHEASWNTDTNTYAKGEEQCLETVLKNESAGNRLIASLVFDWKNDLVDIYMEFFNINDVSDFDKIWSEKIKKYKL